MPRNLAFSNIKALYIDILKDNMFLGDAIKIKPKREPRPDDFPDQVDYKEFMALRNKDYGQPRHYTLSGITSI